MLKKLWESEDGLEESLDFFEEFDEKPEETHTHPYRIIMIELMVLLSIILLIVGYQYSKNNPEKLAKEFVQGVVQQRWNDVYNILYFEHTKEELLTKKMFVSARELNANNAEIVRSEVKSAKPLRKDHSLYQVDYVKNEKNYTEKVPLVKVKGKWWIDGDKKYIRENVKLRVPKGSVVSYDDVELSAKYIEEVEGENDIYELPEIFDGMHYIKVEKKGLGSAERLVNLDSEESFEVSLRYSEEFLEKVGNQALNDIKLKYKKAEIGRTKFVSLNLSDNRVTVEVTGTDRELIEVTVESQYEYRYKPNKYYRRVRKDEGNVKNIFTYSYDGGKLKLEKTELEQEFLRKDKRTELNLSFCLVSLSKSCYDENNSEDILSSLKSGSSAKLSKLRMYRYLKHIHF